MDNDRYERVRELFFEVDDLPPERRDAVLAERCGDDLALIDEVRSLLGEHDADAARREGNTVDFKPADAITSRGSAQSVTSEQFPAGGPRPRTGGDADDPNRTIGGAMRTHAAPRHDRDAARTRTGPPAAAGSSGSTLFRDPTGRRLSKARRRTGAALLLASLIPTAAVGVWIYGVVADRFASRIAGELSGLASAAALSVDAFFDQRGDQATRWADDPDVVDAVGTLVAIADASPGDGDDPDEALRRSPAADALADRLRELSGDPEIKFVLWDRSFKTIASWTPERRDVGHVVRPEGAANLARAARGSAVRFGPVRLDDQAADEFTPESDAPTVGVIVPVRGRGRVIAELLVRGLGWFETLDGLTRRMSEETRTDTYVVDDGVMATAPPRAAAELRIAPEDVAARVRVVDPGPGVPGDRASRPITLIAADLRRGEPTVRRDPYPNYAGRDVFGAGRPVDDWGLGVVVERDADSLDVALSPIRWGFLSLGTLLSLMSVGAAWRLARPPADAEEAHPLGRYDVVDTLGTGGMGAVYRVHHRGLGRDAALKILRGDRQHDDDRARFDREAKLAATLDSPHTVTIYDYGRTAEGDAYCVMQYLRGLTLHEVVTRDGPQPIGRTLAIVRQVADTICDAHAANLTHRDLKPHNIMLSPDPAAGDWAVVFDYGLAKPLVPDDDMFTTMETVWSGTPMYMAPERFRNPSSLDPRSDLYSLGTVAYWLLSGRPPFAQSDPESLFALILNEDPIDASVQRGERLPPDISRWLAKMMAKDIADRYQDARSLANDIDRLRARYPWRVEESTMWWKIYGG